jgi:Ion channel
MFRQLLVGGVVSLGNIAVHAIVMTLVVTVVRRVGSWERRNASLWLASVMVATVGVLLMAHVAEVIVWSVTYLILDAAPSEADVLYFAFVNYTTLGYGDIVPVERWRLIGPITAMNGILLFGWSTAVIFEVLDVATQARRSPADRPRG